MIIVNRDLKNFENNYRVVELVKVREEMRERTLHNKSIEE